MAFVIETIRAHVKINQVQCVVCWTTLAMTGRRIVIISLAIESNSNRLGYARGQKEIQLLRVRMRWSVCLCRDISLRDSTYCVHLVVRKALRNKHAINKTSSKSDTHAKIYIHDKVIKITRSFILERFSVSKYMTRTCEQHAPVKFASCQAQQNSKFSNVQMPTE